MSYDDKLKEYGVKVYRKPYHPTTDDPDEYSEPIDVVFSIDRQEVASIVGSEPWNDYEVECSHPEECIEYDDEAYGRCVLCGEECTWHWEHDVVNEGRDAYGDYQVEGGDVREVDGWHLSGETGVIGEYIKHLQDTW